MPMTEDERAFVRDEMHAAIKRAVERFGGDISDGVAIFTVAAIEVHTSMAVIDKTPMEEARAAFLKIIGDGYPGAYDVMMAHVHGMVAGTARH